MYNLCGCGCVGEFVRDQPPQLFEAIYVLIRGKKLIVQSGAHRIEGLDVGCTRSSECGTSLAAQRLMFLKILCIKS